jgi:hypothetical protein
VTDEAKTRWRGRVARWKASRDGVRRSGPTGTDADKAQAARTRSADEDQRRCVQLAFGMIRRDL